MVGSVVQVANPIADIDGAFDAASDDFFMNLVFQNPFAEFRQEDRTVAQDRTICQSRAVAQDGTIWQIGQLAGDGTWAVQWIGTIQRAGFWQICRAGPWPTVQEIVQSVGGYRLSVIGWRLQD